MKTDKFGHIFSEPFKKAKNRIENLLEEPSPPRRADKSQGESGDEIPFQVSTDLTQIENIRMSLPQGLESKTKKLFLRLSPYFNSGVLWKKSHEKTFPIAGFCKGIAFEMTEQDLKQSFHFPQISLIEIMKSQSEGLLQQLRTWEMLDKDQVQILFFCPHPEYIFLVVSELPDVFLKVHAEKIQREILMSLGDEVE